MRRAMLFEELLLIAYDNEKGTPAPAVGRAIDNSLGGAVLAELALADRIWIERDDPGRFTPVRDLVRVSNPTPLGEPETDFVLHQISTRWHTAPIRWWITEITKPARYSEYRSMLRERLLDRFVQHRILGVRDEKKLGLFSVRRYPTIDSTIEDAARFRLQQLIDGRSIDPLTAILMLLVQTAQVGDQVFPGKPSEREVLETTLSEGGWAPQHQCDTVIGIIAGLKSMVVRGGWN